MSYTRSLAVGAAVRRWLVLELSVLQVLPADRGPTHRELLKRLAHRY